jgi:hypothetical protein
MGKDMIFLSSRIPNVRVGATSGRQKKSVRTKGTSDHFVTMLEWEEEFAVGRTPHVGIRSSEGDQALAVRTKQCRQDVVGVQDANGERFRQGLPAQAVPQLRNGIRSSGRHCFGGECQQSGGIVIE